MLGDLSFLGFYAFVLWVVLCVVVGLSAARHYERNNFGWFVVALFASPIVAWWMLVMVGRKPTQPQSQSAGSRVLDRLSRELHA